MTAKRKISTLTLLTKLAERQVRFRAVLPDGTVLDTLTQDGSTSPMLTEVKNEWDEVLGNGSASH